MPKTKPSAKTLGEFADATTQARHAENQSIARDNRALRATLAERDDELRALRLSVGLMESLNAARLDPPEWLTPKASATDHVAIPSLLLTDIHWDEVVSPSQIGGVNKYNRAIAEQRVRRAFERTVVVSRDYLKGLRYDGFQLFLGGDMISGIIHEELKETNEAQVMESVLSVVEPLEAGIQLLAKEFGKVHVVGVVGNHGRNTKKPRSKFRAADNFDWLIYRMIQRDLAGRKGVTIDVPDSADAPVTIYQTKYLLTHGDQFRGGSGISGLLAPLMIGAHRKTRRETKSGRGFDVMVMGHWHQTINLPTMGVIVGGSIKGYDEHAYLSNYTPERPQQSFWITTPEHGPTISGPIFVDDKKAEGWG
jgi:hypothetical protein